jgi:hypothetical protein
MSAPLLWLAFGLLLLGAEAIVPGPLVFLFFGAGALVVALVVALAPGVSSVAQAAIFACTSVASMLTLRGALQRRFGGAGAASVDGTRGEVATLHEALAPGATGRAEFRGTTWSARHAGDAPLEAGARCRVVRIDELTLWVEPEGSASPTDR